MEKVKTTKGIVKLLLDDPQKYANTVSVKRLAATLKILSDHYYNKQEELVSDEIFDMLKDVLEKRDPTNPFLDEVGAQISKDKVQLPYFMASLDKIKPNTDALESWLKNYHGPYVLSDKLDGVSALYHKVDGEHRLYTRGNGSEGQDISYLIPYVISSNVNLKGLPEGFAIRGELIVSKNNFKKLGDEYKNSRNAVAGLVNSKHYSKRLAKLTDFIAYSVVNPRYKQDQQMEILEEYGFQTVTYRIEKGLTNSMLSDYLVKRREGGEYEVDGIVVVDASKKYSIPKGNPPNGFAFKTVLTDQVAEATVVDVEWRASMHGFLKPRIRIDPISLVGVEITYATAFNGKFVADNKLGPGAKIKLVRSGDVIPHILEVLKPAASGKPKMPSVPYKWNKSGVDLVVKDVHGAQEDVITVKRLVHFFKTLGVMHLSEGILTNLVENGYNTLVKILGADQEVVAQVEGLGEKMVTKIYNGIDEAFANVDLVKLMAGSTIFGRGFGTRKLKVILKAYPDIMIEKWDKQQMIDKIVELDGFDKITSTQFVNNLADFKKFFKEIDTIYDLSGVKTYEVGKTGKIGTEDTQSNLSGLKVVFTGFRDKELQEKVENAGGSVSTSVSSKTDIVVYADTAGSKYKKAVELKKELLTKDEFTKKYLI